MLVRKTTCPNCGREQFTRSPNCYCTFCGQAKWTIDWQMTPEEFWSINSTPKARKAIEKTAALIGVDAKALHILFNTVWNMDGREACWVGFSEVPPEDREFAKAAGVWREPLEWDHKTVIARILRKRDRIERRAVAAAFASSLLNRRLDWRSALGSYARVLHLAPHRFSAPKDRDTCRECGLKKREKISVNHFTVRRILWAGNVCQGELDYALCDLMAFRDPPAGIGHQEKKVLQEMFSALRKLPKKAGLSDLEKSLSGLFPSNKGERQVVLEILGLAGILKPRNSPSLHEAWVPDSEMPEPSSFARKEWRSPVNCWTGEDGLNEAAVVFWFGEL